MLSSSPIKNVRQASHYYSQKDNYYTREKGLEQSEWWGKCAKQFQLSGQVEGKQFLELLQGKLPNGEKLGIVVEGVMKHRPGWDLTFSAPKSVSMMAYIGGDKQLIEAHRQAVFIALSTIEQSAAQARVKTSEGMQYQNTGNLVAALYHHDLSRAKDPQMHTHAVVMNMTQRPDGKVRSLASQIGCYNEKAQGEINGFIERVRHHNRYFSKIYETELAFRVKQLGYEITTDTKSGIFEIAGVTSESIKFFSKRRNQIEEQLEQKGMSGGKAAAVATLATRDAKKDVDRITLNEQWEQNSKNLGLDCKQIIDSAYDKNKTLIPNQAIDQQTIKAIQKASHSLSVFQTTFTLEEIVAEASTYAIRHTLSVESLLSAIEVQLSKGELISLADTKGKTLLMAKSTIEDEKRLITQVKDNKSFTPTVSTVHLTNYLAQHEEINPEYHNHLMTIFGNDRIVLIEGKSAKEALIEPIFNISKSVDLDIAILSPSLIGSRQLAKEVKQAPQNFWEQIKAIFIDSTPKHYSVMQFLSHYNEESSSSSKAPKVLIVDNAHLLSTHQKANLMEWNKIHQSKLILLGRKEVLLPQQRGSSINELIEHGVKSISLPSKLETTLDKRNAVSEIINKISDKIVEVKLSEDRHFAMTKHYTNLNEKDRRSSWLVGQSKTSIEQLNLLTHRELAANNKINHIISLNVLIPTFISGDKAVIASSYQKDQVVRFNETYSSLSITSGEYLRIIQHNKESNLVVLQKENGKQIIWYPDRVAGKTPGKIEVFHEKQRDIGVGESILFHRSIKSKQIVKGDRFTVEDIRQQKMKLKGSDGKPVVIDLTMPYHRHIDYGYAATPHAIAHEKPTYLIADLPTSGFQTDQRRFYQAVSQPNEVWIYTDDHLNLTAHLEKKTGDRLTAHETLKKADEIKKNLHALYDVLEKQIIKKEGDKNTNTIKKSVDAIDYAMRHLAEREAGFTHKNLIQVAMKYAIGDVTKEMLTQVAVEMKKAGILFECKTNDGTLWTTVEAVKTEREILAFAIKDKGTLQPIASDELLSTYWNPAFLRPEQIEAIKAITQSKDRVLSVQGRAGTGKTTMMITLNDVLSAKELLDDGGYQLLGIAPTHKGVKELRSRGITAQTVDSFLSDMRRIQENKSQHDYSKTILVVDEASMVSNRKMLDVLRVVHDFNFRAGIPTGDTEQNPSIEAGKPHDLIQLKLNDTTILLKDVQRQKNTILKEAVKAIYRKDVNQTFSILNNSIKEINTKTANDPVDAELKPDELHQKYYQKRIETIVGDYICLLEKGEDVQMIAPSHKDRKAVNEEVRFQLNKLNLLKGEEQSFSVLSSKDMTGVERSEAINFKSGQILRFSVSSGKTIKSGEYFTIKSINQQHNILTLNKMNGDDKEVVWQVPRSQNRINNTVEVFNREDRNIKIGDKIVWVRTNRKEGILSTDFANVTHIESGLITVKRPDNSVFTFNGKDEKYQHWDHAYAITSYGAQGGTYSTVLAIFESYRKNLMNLKNFLVTITRPENNLRIYTDDKEKLQDSIRTNTGSKISSLEVLGEYPARHDKKNKENVTNQSPEKMNSSLSKSKENVLPRFDKYGIERIKEGLNRDAEKIAIDILGQPKIKGSHFLKFGNNQGSLSVTIKGERQGWWNDFSDNGGRGMLSFIQKYAGLDKQQAIEYGAKWVGIHPNQEDRSKQLIIRKLDEKSQTPDKKLKLEEQKKIEFAKKLTEQSQSIKGTLAEKYLKEHRSIAVDKYSEDIRFHPGIYSKLNKQTLPAMLVVARDESGQIRAVQATYLDESTAQKIDKSIATIQKQTFGLMKGATVNFNGEKGAPTLIAEGTETGLSLATAIKNVNVKITLSKSNFKNINSKTLSEKVIFCLDNDGQNLKSDKLIAESAKRLVENNKQVVFMLPTSLKDQKQDYNDVLKHAGHDAIKRDFEGAISYKDMYGNAQNGTANHLLAHQEMINHDKTAHAILAKNIDSDHKLTPISDQMIANFSKQSLKSNHKIDMKNVDAYKAMMPRHDQNEIAKTIPKIKDIEHEI